MYNTIFCTPFFSSIKNEIKQTFLAEGKMRKKSLRNGKKDDAEKVLFPSNAGRRCVTVLLSVTSPNKMNKI